MSDPLLAEAPVRRVSQLAMVQCRLIICYTIPYYIQHIIYCYYGTLVLVCKSEIVHRDAKFILKDHVVIFK